MECTARRCLRLCERHNAPNPYLEDKERDIPLEDGRMLTKINPAYMTRQLSELASEYKGAQIHITSLNPMRKENAPLPWEHTALKAFETGLPELGAFVDGHFRYMAPSDHGAKRSSDAPQGSKNRSR